MTTEEQTSLVPIAEALPELRAEQYAKVREWDAARMALAGEYEAADGEYLKKIRDALKIAGHGMWTRYLQARDIPYQTANDRIRKAEGRPHIHVTKPRDSLGLPEPPAYKPVAAWPTMDVGTDAPAPAGESVTVDRDELTRLENIETWAQKAGYYGEDPIYGEWGASDDEEDEWNEARSGATPLAAYVPKATPLAMGDPSTEIARLRAIHERRSPSAAAMPFADALIELDKCILISTHAVDAWIDATPMDDWPSAQETLRRIAEWSRDATARFEARRRDSLRLVP